MSFSIFILLAVFALHSTNALKCYELVDSKCTVVNCGGSCYFGNATVNRQLVNKEAKCWNSVEKDSCKPEWHDFDTKYACFCNKDKCNSVYCDDSKTDHGDSSSRSTHPNEFPPGESGSPTDTFSSTTSRGNGTSASSSSFSSPSTSALSSSTSTSTSSESSSSESSASENTDDEYEPSPRSSSTTGPNTTPKSGAPSIIASVSSVTVPSVIIMLLVRLW